MQTMVNKLWIIALIAGLGACGGGDVSRYSESEKNTAQEVIIDELNGEGGSNPDSLTPAELALLPQVSANSAQFADANVVVFLNGSAQPAAGSDTGITTTLWRQLEGPSVELLNSLGLSNLFIAPDVSEDTLLAFQLVAQDSSGRVNADTVYITVRPVASLVRVTGAVVNEADGEVAFLIKLLETSDQPITVRYTTRSETAQEGEDYEAAAGELTFAAGEQEKTVTVALLADSDAEDFETFSLQVTALAGDSVSSNVGSAIIRNSDIEPTATPEPSITPTPPPTVEPSISPEPTATPTTTPTPTPSPPPVDLGSAPTWDLPETGFSLLGEPVNIAAQLSDITDTETVDLDSDSDLDMLVATATTIELMTNNGLGEFSRSTLLVDDSFQNRRVLATNIDGDSDQDFVTITANGDLVLFENTGNGNFTENLIVNSESLNGIQELNEMELADIDGDSDIDIAASYINGSFNWFENTAEQGFVARTAFTDFNFTGSQLSAVDFNNDEAVHFIVTGNLSDTSVIYMLRSQNGEGGPNFSPQRLAETACFDLQLIEFNGDGAVDLLCRSADGFNIDLLVNSGGDPLETSFQTINLVSGTVRIEEMRVFDWDRDGDPDIFVSTNDVSGDATVVGFYENDGEGFSGSPDIPIDKSSERHEFGDFDGDGNTDIIFTWENSNFSYLQQVQQDTFEIRELFTATNIVSDMQAVDIDRDGDLDIVGMSELLYERNDGLNTKHFYFFLENSATEPARMRIMSVLNDVEASYHFSSDIDNDGDIDLITGTFVRSFETGFNLYENLGSAVPGVDEELIAPSASLVSSTYTILNQPLFAERPNLFEEPFDRFIDYATADFNNDGFNDIAAIEPDGSLRYFYSDGNLDFTGIYDSRENATLDEILVGDLNGDEIPDVVTDLGFWFDSATDNTAQRIIDTALTNNQMRLEDTDGDGDLDYVLFDREQYNLFTFINDGQANFELSEIDNWNPPAGSQLFGNSDDFWGLSIIDVVNPDGEGQVLVEWISNAGGANRAERGSAGIGNIGLSDRFTGEALFISDLNADGKEDLLMQFGNELAWFEFILDADFIVNAGDATVGSVSASDADQDPLSYQISGGADAALFRLEDNSANLSLVEPASAFPPQDANLDNLYEVEVTVSDGSYSVSRLFYVRISDDLPTPAEF